MDSMHIRDLRLACIIGTKPAERKKKQNVIINLVLECDLRSAGRSDRLEDALNYHTLLERMSTMVEDSTCFLIEHLAELIAQLCLESRQVKGVTVKVEKPGAFARARGVAVEIRRKRS